MLTIGHSTLAIGELIGLLNSHAVTAVADVRSVPASRFSPQFNREALRRELTASGIHYVFLGKELGARPKDRSMYEQGRVQYERLAQGHLFREGIARLKNGLAHETIALMCTEKDPLDCHRTILISRVLTTQNVAVAHIHSDGRIEKHEQAMRRLRERWHLDHTELFRQESELLEEALRLQGEKIAYEEKPEEQETAAP